MDNIIFQNINYFKISQNFLFLHRSGSLECFDLTTDKPVFQLNLEVRFFTLLNKMLFVEVEQTSDLLVFDLNGTLLKTFNGRLYLWLAVVDKDFLFIPANFDGLYKEAFKLNMLTLEIIEKIEDYRMPDMVSENIGIDCRNKKVCGYDIISTKDIWSFDLGDVIRVHRYFSNGNVIISLNGTRLIALNIRSGQLVWENKAKLHDYTIHPRNHNVYGFSNQEYEVFDANNGSLIVHKNFQGVDSKYQIFSDYSKVYEEGMYYISNYIYNDAKLKFAKINITNHDIEYVHELNAPASPKSMLVPYKGRVFILDANKNLHCHQEN